MSVIWPGRFDFADRSLVQLKLSNPDGLCVAFSATSPVKNPGDNEDSFSVMTLHDSGFLIGIADGVGGHSFGARASKMALDTLRLGLTDATGDVRTAVLNGLDVANRRIIDEIGNGAATTFIGAEISGDELRAYNIGDSGALVFGGQGKIKLQTLADSPVGYALEAGIIDELTALTHDARHIVSNVMGDPNMHVTVSSSVRLRKRDTVLLASDGLFDNFLVDEIIQILRKGALQTSVEKLLEICDARMRKDGKPDDLTVIAFRLN